MIKHVLFGHVILQLDCTNTLNDQLLENVSVEVEVPEGWEMVAEVNCPRLVDNVGVNLHRHRHS